MRVLLVGRPDERAVLRARLTSMPIEVVGEFSSVEAARISGLDVDAVLLPLRAGYDPLISPEALTRREIEVLELLVEGRSNKAIAGKLGISDQTVKFHVAAVCGKLGAANRTDAVRRAIRLGLVSV